jgi:hypothetical protein
MIIAEIAAFFMLVCTTDTGVDQKCLRQMHECFVYHAMESKNPPWFIAEVCSEQWWP